MMYVIEKDDGQPAYLQLYRHVRDDIVNGIYPFNSKLPSKRIIAGDLGLSIVTVEHAYALLCDEGYIEARERSGYFVIFRVGDGFTAAPAVRMGETDRGGYDLRAGKFGRMGKNAGEEGPGRAEKNVGAERLGGAEQFARVRWSGGAEQPFRSGQSGGAEEEASLRMEMPAAQTAETPAAQTAGAAPEFPFSVLTKAMRRVISDRGESILDRSPNSGLSELRGAISRYLARSRGIIAGREQIIIGSGSEYLYGLIVELLGRGRVYGIEFPSYKKIEQVYIASDVKYERLPLGDDGIESGALWASGADVLHISPYRSFPSGVTASASKRHEYMRWAGKKDRYIVEDDFESEFSILKKPEETLFAHTSNDNVIYMNTFSQTISPSLRAGYMVLPKHLTAVFEEKLGFYACTVPTYLQYVLADLIDGGDFERHINRVRRKKREALQLRHL